MGDEKTLNYRSVYLFTHKFQLSRKTIIKLEILCVEEILSNKNVPRIPSNILLN